MNPVVSNPSPAEKKTAKQRKAFFLRRDVSFRLLSVRIANEPLPNEIKQFVAQFTEPLPKINFVLKLINFKNAEVPAHLDDKGRLVVEADEKAVFVGQPLHDTDRNQHVGNGGQLNAHVELQYLVEGDRIPVWHGVMPIFSEYHPRSYLLKNLDRKLERRSVKVLRASPRRKKNPQAAVQLSTPSQDPLMVSLGDPLPYPPSSQESLPQGNSFPSLPASPAPTTTPPVDAQLPSSDSLPELYALLRVSVSECITP